MEHNVIDVVSSIFTSLIVLVTILAIPPLFIWMGWQRIAVEVFRLPTLNYLQCFWLNIGVKALLGKIQINTVDRKDNNNNA